MTLGIARDATQEQVREAYKRLAFKHHPDRNPGDPTAEDRFKRIVEANGILSDPEKRSVYDRGGSVPVDGFSGDPTSWMDWVAGHFGGFGVHRKGRPRG